MDKSVQLFHFINENDIDLRWDGEELSTWIAPELIGEFVGIIQTSIEEGGANCVLTASGFIWIDIVPICEWYGLDPQFLLKKDQ